MDASDCDVASTDWTHWHGIPWQTVYQEVGRLQARIAKAAKAGKWRTVRNLQRLLTRSESAKARQAPDCESLSRTRTAKSAFDSVWVRSGLRPSIGA